LAKYQPDIRWLQCAYTNIRNIGALVQEAFSVRSMVDRASQ